MSFYTFPHHILKSSYLRHAWSWLGKGSVSDKGERAKWDWEMLVCDTAHVEEKGKEDWIGKVLDCTEILRNFFLANLIGSSWAKVALQRNCEFVRNQSASVCMYTQSLSKSIFGSGPLCEWWIQSIIHSSQRFEKCMFVTAKDHPFCHIDLTPHRLGEHLLPSSLMPLFLWGNLGEGG